jgi:universal stress protein A
VMTIRRILYPTDFSAACQPGLDIATSLARDNNAELLIAHVVEPPVEGPSVYTAPVKSVPEAQELLNEVVPPDPKVSYQHRVVYGRPDKQIIRLAEEEKADLIVMGSHGRTAMIRLLMGSVAEAVVRNAPCPVVMIRQPRDSSQDGRG